MHELSDITTALIDFKTLPDQEKESLTEKLFEIYKTRLKGRDKKSFDSQFKDNRVAAIYVLILRKNNVILGYLVFNRYDIQFPASASNEISKSNLYAVFKGQACMHPELENNKCLSPAILKILSHYHQEEPNVNVVIYDSLINPKSYKIVHKISRYAFPSPCCKPTQNVEDFMNLLKKYFEFVSIDNKAYLIRSFSNVINKEISARDKITKYYIEQTGLEPYVSLACLFCFHMVEGNSLNLPATGDWAYEGNTMMGSQTISRARL